MAHTEIGASTDACMPNGTHRERTMRNERYLYVCARVPKGMSQTALFGM